MNELNELKDSFNSCGYNLVITHQDNNRLTVIITTMKDFPLCGMSSKNHQDIISWVTRKLNMVKGV